MDQAKKNETQSELMSSTAAAPDADDRETDRNTRSLDDTRQETGKEASDNVSKPYNDLLENGSGLQSTDGVETEQKPSEIKATEQPTEEVWEAAKAPEGQDSEKTGAPEPDNAPGAESNAVSPAADPSDEDPAVAGGESKETDPPGASESDDKNTSAVDKSEIATVGKEALHPEKSSDDEKEDANPTRTASDDSAEPSGDKASSEDEDRDSGEKKQDPAGDGSTEKDQSEPQSGDAEEETEDLPEFEPRKKISLVKTALTVILLAALFSGFFIFENKSNRKSGRQKISSEVKHAVMSRTNYAKTEPSIEPGDPNYIYYAKVKEISLLRETLLRKQEEIDELKKVYQKGIAELEKEIFDEIRSAHTDTLWQALENKRIEFGLRTIQRRKAYMRQLNQPSEWIYKACEELLYLQRRVTVDLQVSEVASGIDMNVHMQRMNSAIEKYRPTPERLTVDMQAAQREPLEAIWGQIQIRSLQVSSGQAASKNKVISEQVCSGTFKRVTELSEISVETARCIAEMPGTDLFLNDLNEISPRAAKYLFQWKGSWLCLNGFTALSPRVANYLFQWDGGWISLNGLTEFPAEIGEALLQWPGKQLELMGLQYTNGSFDSIGIEYLARWERSGGKLFVPKEVRERIDALNRDSA